VLLCLTLALVVQVLPAWLALGLILPLLLTSGSRQRWLGLVRRTRWLLLSLFLVFALGTPGEALYPDFSAPTREGVLLGLEQGSRLMAVLASVAWLLQGSAPTELAAGILRLAASFRIAEASGQRGVARLLLALQYVENAPRRLGEYRWQNLLEPPGGAKDDSLQIVLLPFRPMDRLVMVLLAAGVAGLLFFQGVWP
jgi:energy-coupling factor transporter transmembrane protein EcfT